MCTGECCHKSVSDGKVKMEQKTLELGTKNVTKSFYPQKLREGPIKGEQRGNEERISEQLKPN